MSDVFPTVGTIRSPVMSHGTAVYEFNNGADDEIMIAEPTWTHDVEELAGDNRYETAGLIVDRTWRFGSADVVIATGANFPDALGAGALAGQMNVPLVLTDGAHLSPKAADTLLDLGVNDDVIVIGGPTAISDTVITEIEDLLPSYDSPIRRIAGDDRYQTAAAIADQVAGLGGVQEPYGFVCTGLNYPDALAASSMAYALGIPIYLVQGESVPQALIEQMLDNGVTIPLIVGGTGAVSQAIEDQLLAEPAFEDVWRVWGSDRYATATELASFAQHVFEFGASGVCVATGQSFPDALAGGQLAGNRYAPLLLTATTGLSPATHDWFVENADLETIRSVTFLGGPVAISPDVRADIDALLH